MLECFLFVDGEHNSVGSGLRRAGFACCVDDLRRLQTFWEVAADDNVVRDGIFEEGRVGLTVNRCVSCL